MNLWTAALDLLFPPKCPFCQKVLEAPRDPVCPACQQKLPWLEGKQAERKVDFTAGCVSPLAYRDGVPEAVHRYKFSRVQAYGPPFGLLVAQCVRDHVRQMPDGLTWTPLSKKRLRSRGFDQAELLARSVGAALALPVFPTLEKVRDTVPQSEQADEAARRGNALGAYRPLAGTDVAGKRLLLVDDVVTSGATLSECARVLLDAGADQILCATLAQARPE